VSLRAVENAQRFNPVDPQLRQREAELLMKTGDWPGAARAYEEEIRLDPQHYVPYALLAIFHEKMGEPDKALPLYQRASDLNPLDPNLKREVSKLSGKDRD
jgi:tetratricopeptide (TPR) repeat protein